jgi:hypothetical protein
VVVWLDVWAAQEHKSVYFIIFTADLLFVYYIVLTWLLTLLNLLKEGHV